MIIINAILDFFNCWSSAIQAIMVIVLVSVTIWYAYSTKKMAKLMHKEYKLASMPFLSIDRDVDRVFKERNHENNMIQLKFHYLNVGKVPIEHYTKSITLDGKKINAEKVTTILFPNQKGVTHTNFYRADRKIGEGDGLEGEITVIYWAQGIAENKFSLKRKFKLAPGIHTFILKEKIEKC